MEPKQLDQLFAETIGWEKRGRIWLDYNGNQHPRIPDYSRNDVLAWGGMQRDRAIAYTVRWLPDAGEYNVSCSKNGRGVLPAYGAATDKVLATAIYLAVC